jgi:hypothetical protein
MLPHWSDAVRSVLGTDLGTRSGSTDLLHAMVAGHSIKPGRLPPIPHVSRRFRRSDSDGIRRVDGGWYAWDSPKSLPSEGEPAVRFNFDLRLLARVRSRSATATGYLSSWRRTLVNRGVLQPLVQPARASGRRPGRLLSVDQRRRVPCGRPSEDDGCCYKGGEPSSNWGPGQPSILAVTCPARGRERGHPPLRRIGWSCTGRSATTGEGRCVRLPGDARPS